ncbi:MULTISPECIES: hypothetical protein [unclassified Pantoea]|uniref:hypothetical protein n=1 Tax=unclassified Pantoea TaxID=2630326 RepID=UPI001CD3630E|nr:MULTISPECIES: hypothetical protein [unclassified Pantoea]MCA1176174.1 hypothetical protein [Pantoea sp. alder69]MCA1249144.1 hypothetical protein [Pantoea sp. alder70]MCA1264781.1 hypothetical protein [Pantoea sp. alder81]
MTYSLDDFLDNNTASINDFTDGRSDSSQPQQAMVSSPSVRNSAATTALLNAPNDPNQVIPTYDTISSEHAQLGYSPTQNQILDARKTQEASGFQQAMYDSLANPEVPDLIKQNILQAHQEGRIAKSNLLSAQGMLGSQEAGETNPQETAEATVSRDLFAAGMDKAIEFKRQQQAIYNATAMAQEENGLTTTVVGMGENMVPGVTSAKSARLYSSLSNDTKGVIASFFLQGSSKAALADKFNNLPLDQRMAVLDGIATTVNGEGRTILLPSEKDNANLATLQAITQSGSYTLTDETLDNLSGLLDMSGLAVPFKFAARLLGAGKTVKEASALVDAGKAGETATNAEVAIQQRQLMAQQQPSAPLEIIKDANPDKARRILAGVAQEETEEFSQAMTGTGRDNAFAGYIAAQPKVVDNTVQSKVYDPTRYDDFQYMPDNDTLDLVRSASAPNLSTVEKRRLDANVTNDFQSATGMVNRKEMTTVGPADDGNGLDISAVYGPSDSGWTSLQDAVSQAQFALRKYGVDEKDINVLVKDGDTYHPVPYSSLKDAEGDITGDYLLQVKQNYKYNAGDLDDSQFELFDVKKNWGNRLDAFYGAGGRGSATSNFIAPESMFHPEFMRGAVLSDLKKDVVSEELVKVAKNFTDGLQPMSQERRNAIIDTIKEANAKGITYNYTDLAARGFNETEIRTFEHFKKTQDTLWHLTNADMVRSYRTRGFGRMVHPQSGLDVIARPVSLNSVRNNTTIYDAAQDTVRVLTPEDRALMNLRNSGLAELAHPIEIDGQQVLHVVNDNHAAGTYLRGLSDDDTVMSYRKGYYSVRYSNPHFIEKKLVDADGVAVKDEHGQDIWQAYATAPDMLTANKAIERYKKTRPSDYRVRSDLKGGDYDKASTQAMSAGGLSAQRVRGKRLEDAIGSNTELDGAHLQSPIEAMSSSIESVSSRISYRDWIETSKKRLLATYSDVMPLRNGRPDYPTNISEIAGTGRRKADARAMFEHIRAMENGYNNMLDSVTKTFFTQAADALGGLSVKAGDNAIGKALSGTEKASRTVAGGSVSGTLKSLSFTMMIALNPFRQLAVQAAQAFMTLGRHPSYITHIFDDATLLLMDKFNPNAPEQFYKLFGRSKAEFKAMKAAMESSGVTKGLARHEMVQGMLGTNTDLAVGYANRTKHIVSKGTKTITGLPRKIGFDSGEYLVQASSYFAHYDEALKASVKAGKGTTLSADMLKQVASDSRQLTGNFARSGQMALNHNELSVIGQYGQVPLKMIGLLFNRSIPVKARVSMAVFGVSMFGAPDWLGQMLSEHLPDDATQRELILGGLSNVLTNGMIEAVWGQKSQVDWGGGVNPYDPQGVIDMVGHLFKDGIGEAITNAPVGSLLMGSNPRITNLVRDFGIASGLVTDPSSDTSVEKWHAVMQDVANMSSGYSNGYKAWLMLKYQREYSATGAMTRDNVTTPEAFAKALGFQSLAQARSFAVMDDIRTENDKYNADVDQYFNDVSRRLMADGVTAEQQQYLIRMSQYGMSAFPNNVAAHKRWMANMMKQIEGGDRRLFDSIMSASGWATREDVIGWINQASLKPEQREALLKIAKWSYSEDELKQMNKLK